MSQRGSAGIEFILTVRHEFGVSVEQERVHGRRINGLKPAYEHRKPRVRSRLWFDKKQRFDRADTLSITW